MVKWILCSLLWYKSLFLCFLIYVFLTEPRRINCGSSGCGYPCLATGFNSNVSKAVVLKGWSAPSWWGLSQRCSQEVHEVKAFFIILLRHYLFHCANICAHQAEAMMRKTPGALEWIGTVAPDCASHSSLPQTWRLKR